jgi:hypothetical protein
MERQMNELTMGNSHKAPKPDAIEQEIQAKGLIATRLTPADIQNTIVGEQYYIFPGTTVTVCCLTLKNGAKVIGHNYGSIDPSKQDWNIGQNEAKLVAFEKVWELEGYLLRHKMALAAQAV